MRMRSVAVSIILVSLAALACQKDEALPPHQASAPQATEAASPAPMQAPPSATASPVAAVPASSPTVMPASGGIATADGEQSGVSLMVTELKRSSGGTATLKFTIVNNGAEAVQFSYRMADPEYSGVDYNTLGGVHLIDPVNKKKYFVVRDSDRHCVCSRDLKDIAPGSRLNLWAKFPAPADAQQVTIVVPHFIPMDDVPIS